MMESGGSAAPKARGKFSPPPPSANWFVLGGGSNPPSANWFVLGGGSDPPSANWFVLGGGSGVFLFWAPPPGSEVHPPVVASCPVMSGSLSV